MAKSHELAFYSVNIKKKNARQRISINTFKIGDDDIFSLFVKYFEGRQEEGLKDEVHQTLLKVNRLESDRDLRFIKGTIETGEYGYEGKLVDAETGEEKPRNFHDAEVLPFYFLASFPSGKAQGIIVLERFQVHGIKTALERDLREFFRKAANDTFSVSLDVLSYEALLEQFAKSDLKEVKLIKYSLPTDIRTAFSNQNLDPDDSLLELNFKPKANKNFRFGFESIVSFLENYHNSEKSIPVTKVIEIQGVEYDTIKVKFDVNGKERTVNLANPFASVSYFDVSDEVETENGLTLFNSIDSIAQSHLEDFENRLDVDNT